MRAASVALALALASGLAPISAAQETPRYVAFLDVNVVPMDTERVLLEQTVLIEDGRIAAIGRSGQVPVPEDAVIVHARGQYLLPGLSDLHVHILDEGDLTVYLANGVTTVRNLMGGPWHLELRERIRSGELLGPHFFTSGPFVNEPQVKTPDDARRAVAEQAAAGYDCIKIHGPLRLDTYRALLQAAKEAGLPVVGHVPRNLRLEDVLALHGQADISHVEEYLYTYFDRGDVDATPENMEAIATLTKNAGTAVVPTLIAYELIVRQVEDLDRELAVPEMAWVSPLTRLTWSPANNKYRRDFTADDAPVLLRNFAFLERFTKTLHDAGVLLLLGTDALNPTVVPGFSAHQELALLVESGLSPYEALRTATVNAGTFLSGAPGPGSITVGRPADLVLLDGNPLEDVANAALVVGVHLGDRWLTQEELRARMTQLRADYERESAFMARVDLASCERAAAYYHQRKEADPKAFVFREAGIASLVLGYELTGKAEAAVVAAELYTEEYPDSWRAWTRMAEALALDGMADDASQARAHAQELRGK